MDETTARQRAGLAAAPKRGTTLTVLLLIFGVMTALSTVVNLVAGGRIVQSIPNAPAYSAHAVFAIGILGILAVIGIIATWYWHRWGTYLYGAVAIAVFLINMATIGGWTPFIGPVGAGLLLFFTFRQWDEFIDPAR